MLKLKIKSQSLPERCEICHQTDCFDASRNYCSRCGTAGSSLERGSKISGTWEPESNSSTIYIASIISAIIGALIIILSFVAEEFMVGAVGFLFVILGI